MCSESLTRQGLLIQGSSVHSGRRLCYVVCGWGLGRARVHGHELWLEAPLHLVLGGSILEKQVERPSPNVNTQAGHSIILRCYLFAMQRVRGGGHTAGPPDTHTHTPTSTHTRRKREAQPTSLPGRGNCSKQHPFCATAAMGDYKVSSWLRSWRAAFAWCTRAQRWSRLRRSNPPPSSSSSSSSSCPAARATRLLDSREKTVNKVACGDVLFSWRWPNAAH